MRFVSVIALIYKRKKKRPCFLPKTSQVSHRGTRYSWAGCLGLEVVRGSRAGATEVMPAVLGGPGSVRRPDQRSLPRSTWGGEQCTSVGSGLGLAV